MVAAGDHAEVVQLCETRFVCATIAHNVQCYEVTFVVLHATRRFNGSCSMAHTLPRCEDRTSDFWFGFRLIFLAGRCS